MQVLVLLNAAAGSSGSDNGNQEQQVRDALSAVKIDAEIRIIPGARLTDEARSASVGRGNIVIAGGGDGTISAVAGGLAGSDRPMGILPFGTLNHFARDLGIPLKLQEAVRCIAAGNIRAVDVGEVNGRIFINNSSIGLYPQIVQKRDRQMQRLGRGKWLAMLMAAVAVFRRFPIVQVRITTGEQTLHRTSPFVMIGNNRYNMNLLSLGERTRLDQGELSLYFANRTGRFGMLRLALRAMLGRLNQAKDFDLLHLPEVWIETSKKTLRVSADGEITRMTPPLHYRIRPGALKVLAPPINETKG